MSNKTLSEKRLTMKILNYGNNISVNRLMELQNLFRKPKNKRKICKYINQISK